MRYQLSLSIVDLPTTDLDLEVKDLNWEETRNIIGSNGTTYEYGLIEYALI